MRFVSAKAVTVAVLASLFATACSSTPDPGPALDEARTALRQNVAFGTREWPTDWTQSTIDVSELMLGTGASEPRDAIPPIDEPKYESSDAAAVWLVDREPGVLLQIEGDVRFFPLSIINRHEVVNDVVGGVDVTVTYCPLCNSAVAFEREVDGDIVRFGVSGLLRNNDLVMWDDRTVSLWQQATGRAIVGELAGTELTMVPTSIVSFGDFRADFPDGQSLSRETGFDFVYGTNPYENLSGRFAPLILFERNNDGRFFAMERVVGVSFGDIHKAYPFSALTNIRVVNDVLADRPIVVFWGSPDTADALNRAVVAESSAVGTALALDPVVDEQTLTFSSVGGRFVDAETQSTWTLLGRAIEGPLEGTQLETITHRNDFWFAWTAFFPETLVYS
jgi:hypothetical protein